MTTAILSEQEMWQAVATNDRAYDGRFVVAVRTTGVYCRPSCSARLPRPGNVAYYDSPETAEAAGFRACKRCRPADALAPQADLAQRVCRYLEAHAEEGTITLAQLSDAFHVSPYHLQRTFKQATGLSPRRYQESLRLEALRRNLRDGATVTDAAYAAGFGSGSRLYDRAADPLGMRPQAYRRGGEAAEIRYATAGCPLGVLLVATTERGLCAVRLGDSAEALVGELRAEFPAAELSRADESLEAAVAAIAGYLAGERTALDLPLDIQATAFERRVWEALRQIPYGETRSYGQVAEAIGRPTAARAVGNACSRNPTALVIPCHRVVRGDGAAGAYRWGAARKEWLLRQEQGGQG